MFRKQETILKLQAGVESNANIEDDLFEKVMSILSKMKHLTIEQKSKLRAVIIKNKEVFSDKPDWTTVYEHRINLTSDKHVIRKNRL